MQEAPLQQEKAGDAPPQQEKAGDAPSSQQEKAGDMPSQQEKAVDAPPQHEAVAASEEAPSDDCVSWMCADSLVWLHYHNSPDLEVTADCTKL